MASDPYKRQQFNAGITQRTNQNFARFDRAIQARQAVKQKVAAKKQANKGTFIPTPITEKVASKFTPQKAKLNQYVLDTGVQYGSTLDQKSDDYNANNAATYNNLKNSTLTAIVKMNEAFSDYSTIMENYQKGELDFSPEEYEKIQDKWNQINQFVENPDRLGFDERGNVTVAINNKETGEDEQINLSSWDALLFDDALGAQKEPDYLKNFEDLMGASADDFNQSFDDAIIKNGGWDSPDNMGAMADWIEATSPGATDEGIALMMKDQRYRDEYKQWVVNERQNQEKDPRPYKEGTSFNKVKPAPIGNLLKVDTRYTGDLSRGPDGELKDDAALREHLRVRIAADYRNNPTNQVAFDSFMQERFGSTDYTEEDLLNEWVKYSTLEVAPYTDVNKNITADGGWVDPEVKGVGVVTADTNAYIEEREISDLTQIQTTYTADMRYNTGEDEGEKFDPKNRQARQSTFKDDTGLGYMAYTLQGTNQSDFPDFTYNFVRDAGAFVLGNIGKVKDTDKPNALGHHGLTGQGQFAPDKLLNNVPMLASPVDFANLSKIGSSRSNWVGSKKEEAFNVELKRGAILSNELLDELKAIYPKDVWRQYVKYGPAMVGSVKFTDSADGGNEYTAMIPITPKIVKDLEGKTNHNFSAMTNMETYLEQFTHDQLLEIGYDPNSSPALIAAADAVAARKQPK